MSPDMYIYIYVYIYIYIYIYVIGNRRNIYTHAVPLQDLRLDCTHQTLMQTLAHISRTLGSLGQKAA